MRIEPALFVKTPFVDLAVCSLVAGGSATKLTDEGVLTVGRKHPGLLSRSTSSAKGTKGRSRPGPSGTSEGPWRAAAEKGLLITTGSFTKDAQNEANRDGAPPVELLDGEQLCDLFKECKLGVEVRQRVEEEVAVQPTFFAEYGASV